ncbi:hypothetical protein [Streptomyces sp. I05A-00742]|uniref:hypothetical protein n=1 Tax=Streptomyces sp. I05A-00742 TaxID=2732853 RepID=UPI0014890F1C|nr:hypothetical protein [Streptomyces sp. I05A-00742]
MAQQMVHEERHPAPLTRARQRGTLPLVLVSAVACSLLLTSCGSDGGAREGSVKTAATSGGTGGGTLADDEADGGEGDEAEDMGAGDDEADADDEYDEEEDEEEADGEEEEEDDDEETSASAYEEGFDTGQDVLEARGKGAAVREVVWGGCEQRAKEAETAYPDAWIRGCRKGVQTFRDK